MRKLLLVLAVNALLCGQAAAQQPPIGSCLGAFQDTASATGTTGAITATLGGLTGLYTYVCNMDMSVVGGTAAANLTLSGLAQGNTFTNYIISNATPGVQLQWNFTPCIQSNTIAGNIIATFTDTTATHGSINLSGCWR
jgi:hypothetical protein